MMEPGFAPGLGPVRITVVGPRTITWGQFTMSMTRAAKNVHDALVNLASVAGKGLENAAKLKLGASTALNAQSTGMFPSWQAAPLSSYWPPLAAATIEDKLSKGYATPSPLLRTAAMRDTIGHTVEDKGTNVVVTLFTTSEYAPYHELGTVDMPPRPFIGPTVFEMLAPIQQAIAGFATIGLMQPYVSFPRYGTIL